MKKLPKKGVLLFGAAFAVCTFAVPSMASAASWAVITTTHQLFSPNLTFTTSFFGHAAWTCEASELDVDVASAATLRITATSFRNCPGSGAFASCTVTPVGTQFPWTATAPTTTNLQFHGMRITVAVDTTPGSSDCAFSGLRTTLTGTLTGGSWDPSSVGTNRRVTFASDPGLVNHTDLGILSVLISGEFHDTTGTLNLLD